MKVSIKLFAGARELAGQDVVDVELPDRSPVSSLRSRLLNDVPALQPLARHLVFAVNQEYASDDTMIAPGAEVACIPPVSGG